MKASYKTIKSFSSSEIIIQKSRFIGWAAPVSSEKDALDLIQKAKDTYKDASHHCYAYTLGTNMGIMRYSDAGEPSGTAGLPMMEVIKKENVRNCICVVTRYFGGVLLGAGGLLRAYTQGTSVALKAAGIVEMVPTVSLLCEVSYSQWDRVQHHIQSMPVQLLSPEFTTAVAFTLLVREKDLDPVMQDLISITESHITMLEDSHSDMAWDI